MNRRSFLALLACTPALKQPLLPVRPGPLIPAEAEWKAVNPKSWVVEYMVEIPTGGEPLKITHVSEYIVSEGVAECIEGGDFAHFSHDYPLLDLSEVKGLVWKGVGDD